MTCGEASNELVDMASILQPPTSSISDPTDPEIADIFASLDEFDVILQDFSFSEAHEAIPQVAVNSRWSHDSTWLDKTVFANSSAASVHDSEDQQPSSSTSFTNAKKVVVPNSAPPEENTRYAPPSMEEDRHIKVQRWLMSLPVPPPSDLWINEQRRIEAQSPQHISPLSMHPFSRLDEPLIGSSGSRAPLSAVEELEPVEQPVDDIEGSCIAPPNTPVQLFDEYHAALWQVISKSGDAARTVRPSMHRICPKGL